MPSEQADWIFNRREEARRLFREDYREWLAEGALVQPIYGRAA